MPRITYTTPSGKSVEVEVENGLSVMEGAVDNCIDGIVAECGGACACATCHCYVDREWVERLPDMDEMEDSMLDSATDRRRSSRLSCQLAVTDQLDGLKVVIADNDQ